MKRQQNFLLRHTKAQMLLKFEFKRTIKCFSQIEFFNTFKKLVQIHSEVLNLN